MYSLDGLLDTALFKGIPTTCSVFCSGLQLSRPYISLAEVVYRERYTCRRPPEISNIFTGAVYCSLETMCLQFAKSDGAVAKTPLETTSNELLSNDSARLRPYARMESSLISFIISCCS
jgi:hypothetical protein